MFYSKKGKTVFLMNPKTGTRSVLESLSVLFRDGSDYWGHSQKIPDQLLTLPCSTYMTVRDPYDRVCSAYWSTYQRALSSGDDRYGYVGLLGEGGTVLDWLRHAREWRKDVGGIHNVSEYPQCQWYTPNGGVDVVVRYENLQEHFHAAFPAAPRLKMINVSEGRPETKDLMTPLCVKEINSIYEDDFTIFGYKKWGMGHTTSPSPVPHTTTNDV